jgi:hypothetical protein
LRPQKPLEIGRKTLWLNEFAVPVCCLQVAYACPARVVFDHVDS